MLIYNTSKPIKKQIVLINGPSSSGKSTLAPHLLDQLNKTFDQKYALFSIDDFITWQTDRFPSEDEICTASANMYKEALKTLKSCDGAIIDHIITSERVFNQLAKAFEECNIFPIEVTCPLRILKDRELERNDRCIGFAEATYSEVYQGCEYDMTVDTYFSSTLDCILKIIYNGLLQNELFDY